MDRAPEWTEKEFKVLIENPEMLDSELAELLPNRTAGAVETVRSFVHSYHSGGNMSGLPQMMLRMLAYRKGSVVCPKCGERF